MFFWAGGARPRRRLAAFSDLAFVGNVVHALYAVLIRVLADGKKVRAGGHTSKIFDRLIKFVRPSVAYIALEQRALLK